jgi:thiol-disulfide isomerase/thioredoxin
MSHYLTTKDFFLNKTEKGNMLCIRDLQGIALVTIFAESCATCQSLVPKLRQASLNFTGCRILFVDLLKNRELVELSKKSVTTITEVPYIMIYRNGQPFVRYTGKKSIEDIFNTLTEIIQRVNEASRKQFYIKNEMPSQNIMNNQMRNPRQQTIIPVNEVPVLKGTGIPYNIVCDNEDVCYIKLSGCDGESCMAR